MNLALTIARRYLFSRKSTNVINVISVISMTGMMVGAMAMILVLSVFNGFGDLVASLYNSFYSDIVITAEKGKTFSPDNDAIHRIESLGGIEALSYTREENAIIEYKDRFHTVTLKGVDDKFADVTDIDSKIVFGSFKLKDQGYFYTVLGAGVDIAIGANLEDPRSRIKVYLIKRGIKPSLDPSQAFEERGIPASGVFETQQDFDNKYILVPIEFLQDLAGDTSQYSAIEMAVTDPEHTKKLESEIKEIMGEGFLVQNKFEQNEFIYKVHRTEKWVSHAILSLMLIIASFNIIGSLSMLVIEKKKDISILKTMGGTETLVRRIFLLEGILHAVISCTVGFALAIILIVIQQQFHVIPLRGTFAVSSFPVSMEFLDFVWVFVTICCISLLAAWIPAARAARMRIALSRK